MQNICFCSLKPTSLARFFAIVWTSFNITAQSLSKDATTENNLEAGANWEGATVA